MLTVLKHADGVAEVSELADGRRRVSVTSETVSIDSYAGSIETGYPVELIDRILAVKGPRMLCDEIRREEDPLYVKICLEKDILAYVPEGDFAGKRILDFGCGGGASTAILGKMFPAADIVGIDLDSNTLSLAEARAKHFGLTKLTFLCSPAGDKLANDIGEFDFVVLSATLEHMFANERKVVLEQIWSILKPGGVLFIDQTPYRYFPFEGHTTYLPFINYLPDKMAYFTARKFSKRAQVRQAPTWDYLLRYGIRGSCPSEILKILKKADPGFSPEFLKPGYLGFKDRVDVWYGGYAVSIAHKYPKVKIVQKILRLVAKFVYALSGIVLLPTVSVAVRKK